MMQGLDGLEVRKRLKENPEVSDIPFIFITTIGMPKDVLTGFKSGEWWITSPNLQSSRGVCQSKKTSDFIPPLSKN